MSSEMNHASLGQIAALRKRFNLAYRGALPQIDGLAEGRVPHA